MDGGGATWSSEGYQHYSNNKTTTILNNLITTSSLKQLSNLQPYHLQPLLLGAARVLRYLPGYRQHVLTGIVLQLLLSARAWSWNSVVDAFLPWCVDRYGWYISLVCCVWCPQV